MEGNRFPKEGQPYSLAAFLASTAHHDEFCHHPLPASLKGR